MAATRKSPKRAAAKKRPAAKRQSPKKKKKSKAAAPKATKLKRKARKGLKAARGGIDTVLQAGGKTWKTLKSTTAQVVEGVKETFVGEPRSSSRRSSSR
jgi:hypothetical protein